MRDKEFCMSTEALYAGKTICIQSKYLFFFFFPRFLKNTIFHYIYHSIVNMVPHVIYKDRVAYPFSIQ